MKTGTGVLALVGVVLGAIVMLSVACSPPKGVGAIPEKTELIGPVSAYLMSIDRTAAIGPADDWSTPTVTTFNGKPVYRIEGVCRVKGETRRRVFHLSQEKPWIVVSWMDSPPANRR